MSGDLAEAKQLYLDAVSRCEAGTSPDSRYRCTAAAPWGPSKGRWVEHDDIHEVGEQEDGWPGGDIVTYECRSCGHRWRAELPQ